MKTCSKCKIEKSFDEFNSNKQSKDGKYPSCKICQRNKSKESYESRKDSIIERSIELSKDDPDAKVSCPYCELKSKDLVGAMKHFNSRHKNGYKLIRIWESEFRNDVSFILKK